MIRRFIVIVLVALALSSVSCKKEEVKVEKERVLNKEMLNQLKQSEDYNYDKVVQQNPNPIFQFWREMFRFFGSGIGTYVGYGVILVLVGGLIFFLLRLTGKASFSVEGERRASKPNTIPKEEDTPLSLQEIEARIASDIKQQDYRSAIRYSFLAMLLRLNDQQMIAFHSEKTNAEYLMELPGEQQAPFRALCRIYDYIWYGEYPASLHLWEQFNQTRQNLIQREGHSA